MRDKIFKDLESGLDGGYTELLSMTAEEVAKDLHNYADYNEEETIEQMVPFIEEWQLQQSKESPLAYLF